MPKRYPEEFRKQVIACFEEGESIELLYQKPLIARSALYRWIKEYQPIFSADKVYSLSDFNTILRRKERGDTIVYF